MMNPFAIITTLNLVKRACNRSTQHHLCQRSPGLSPVPRSSYFSSIIHRYFLNVFLPCGATINAQHYKTTVTNLRVKIRQNLCGSLTSGVILNGNVRLHMANTTKQKLAEYGWEILQQPPCSPDLSPCNFHTLGPLKKHLTSKKFDLEYAVHKVVRSWLQQQSKDFYEVGILWFGHKEAELCRQR